MSANISIFVPHNGCPNMCSFCNQFAITSHLNQPTADDVDIAVETAIKSCKYDKNNTEIAFFGGSFTAIDKEYMTMLLSTASKYVKRGVVKGIRISTRPDAIDNQTLKILKDYNVTTIELGAQSMVDSVLKSNRRGHTAADVVKASKLIKDHGFSLGLQMMTGLYNDDDSGALYTCEKFIEINPACVRIYPTVVLKNTLLEKLFYEGKYTPQSVEKAADLCSAIIQKFSCANIQVIRVGLHTIDEKEYVCGPWHPAFGEICSGYIQLGRIKSLIKSCGNYFVYVNPSMLSKTIGHKRANIQELAQLGINIKVISNKELDLDEIIIKEVR